MNTDYQLGERRLKQLDAVDAMSPDLRALVHEVGLPIVYAFLIAGMKDPAAIRRIVFECWRGARQQGQKNGARDVVDWLLMRSEALSFDGLVRLLDSSGLVIAPKMPTKEMVQASMAEVSKFDPLITKSEKHKRRLIAALRAA